jgi:malate dehydrogenase
MFSRLARSVTPVVSSSVRTYKVAVVGASGGIGQPLALLLKLDPLVTELALYDVVRTPGTASRQL